VAPAGEIAEREHQHAAQHAVGTTACNISKPLRYLEDKNRPASTTIAISGLAREGALLEVEAVAVLPLAASSAAASKSRSKVTSKKRGRSSSTKAAR
jgi:hypothetical protein